MKKLYFDHAATTPLDPRVLEEMLPYLKEDYGNPSSVHSMGRRARHAVEDARERVAAVLQAEPGEIVFTSGGTESDNAAIRGVIRATGKGLVTCAAEHEAVLRTAESLGASGVPASILKPTPGGAVDPEDLEAALKEDVALASIMHANNEVGTFSAVDDVASNCARRNVLFHCDAVQTAGIYPVSARALGADLISISSHKMYGPKGAGALFVRAGIPFEPVQHGGAQERGRRGGTENVAAIVGFARAFELAREEAADRQAHLAALRSRLIDALASTFGNNLIFNSPRDEGQGVAHVVSVSFPPQNGAAVDGEMLLLNLDLEGVLVSAGSACTSGAIEPSHVLLAMGRDRATASATVRFSPGRSTAPEDVDRAVEILWRVHNRMRHAA